MRISLVIATLGRIGELDRLLRSLYEQEYTDLEVIIVDQNSPGFLIEIVDKYRCLLNLTVVPGRLGLSKARNDGLRLATGEVIGFPDDDCWYPPELLNSIANWFQGNIEYQGFTFVVRDENGDVTVTKFDKEPGEIDRFNVWRRATSISLFLYRDIVRKVQGFDENLGVGANTRWGAGEDIDLPIRIIESGGNIFYHPEVYVGHPSVNAATLEGNYGKIFRYACGMGYVLVKNRFPLAFRLKMLVRPLGGIFLSVVTNRWRKASYYTIVLIGRFVGMKDGL